MDIQARKIHFVLEFLRLQDEELIKKFENMMRLENKKTSDAELSSITIEQLYEIIDKAEEDSKQGRLTAAAELRNEIDSWT